LGTSLRVIPSSFFFLIARSSASDHANELVVQFEKGSYQGTP
jgi:hypothetical protein